MSSKTNRGLTKYLTGSRLFMVTLAVAALCACVSDGDYVAGDFEAAPLFGMVYDLGGKPCVNAAISLDEETTAQTDINGRFVLQSVTKGSHTVNVRKSGYEDLNTKLDFVNRNQVLYLRVTSFDQLLAQTEQALSTRSFGEAESLFTRAEAIIEDDPVALFLKAIYYRLMREPQKAIDALTKAIRDGTNEPPAYLLLADIYEHDFTDTAQAISYLEQYLKLQGDPDIQKRVDALRESLTTGE